MSRFARQCRAAQAVIDHAYENEAEGLREERIAEYAASLVKADEVEEMVAEIAAVADVVLAAPLPSSFDMTTFKQRLRSIVKAVEA